MIQCFSAFKGQIPDLTADTRFIVGCFCYARCLACKILLVDNRFVIGVRQKLTCGKGICCACCLTDGAALVVNGLLRTCSSVLEVCIVNDLLIGVRAGYCYACRGSANGCIVDNYNGINGLCSKGNIIKLS